MSNKLTWHIVRKDSGVIVQTYRSNKVYDKPIPEPFTIVLCKAGC
jgi:hypothetical protein